MPDLNQQQLVSDYKPDSSTLDSLAEVSLLLIVGPSGVGKTSLATNLGYPIVVGDTSRQMRPGEQEGLEYRFRTEAQMLDDIARGNYVQAVIDSGGDLKATHINSFPASGIAVFTIIAEEVENIRQMPFKTTTTIFVTPPSYEIWMERMKAHQLSAQQLEKRLAEARRSLKLALADGQTHFILNDELYRAIAQTKGLVEGKIDEQREQTAKNSATQLLEHI